MLLLLLCHIFSINLQQATCVRHTLAAAAAGESRYQTGTSIKVSLLPDAAALRSHRRANRRRAGLVQHNMYGLSFPIHQSMLYTLGLGDCVGKEAKVRQKLSRLLFLKDTVNHRLKIDVAQRSRVPIGNFGQ
uniref:Putative secreted peptide n=1 Tax=Anopheles braziliensis TaxID=58242 RepID=A0A2M3ZSY6_9DIPT